MMEDLQQRTQTSKEKKLQSQKKYREKNKDKIARANKKYYNSKAIERRAKIKEYLGGAYVCKYCGYTHTTTSPFDWHHREPKDKLFNPMGRLLFEWKILKEELDKCDFICKCCHSIHHYG